MLMVMPPVPNFVKGEVLLYYATSRMRTAILELINRETTEINAEYREQWEQNVRKELVSPK